MRGSGSRESRKMPANIRLVRWTHLIFNIPILAYIYSPDSIPTVPRSRVTSQRKVPFDFAQGRLSTPQIIALR